MDDKPQCYNNRNTYGITILFATQWHDNRQRIEKSVKTSQYIQQGRTRLKMRVTMVAIDFEGLDLCILNSFHFMKKCLF